MTYTATVVSLLDHRIGEAFLRARRALESWERSRADWIAATIELAGALWEARQQHADNKSFAAWLIGHHPQISRDDRAALVNIGKHLHITAIRETLEATQRRSWEHVWRNELRPLLPSSARDEDDATAGSETQNPKRGPRPKRPPRRTAPTNTRQLSREIKLGKDAMTAIKGTSLDSIPEHDALIRLKEHSPEAAARLIADAKAGKIVSALALIDGKTRKPHPTLDDLKADFKKQGRSWHRATLDVREAFIAYLTEIKGIRHA